MLYVSLFPIKDWEELVNEGFGNRCDVCGKHFNKKGFCNNGHIKNVTYYYSPHKDILPISVDSLPTESTNKMVTCSIYYGNRCSICGAFFGDNDDICANKHQIGQQYPPLIS